MSEQFHRRWINISDPQFLLGVFARPLNRNPNRVELNLIQLGCDFDEKYLVFNPYRVVPALCTFPPVSQASLGVIIIQLFGVFTPQYINV